MIIECYVEWQAFHRQYHLPYLSLFIFSEDGAQYLMFAYHLQDRLFQVGMGMPSSKLDPARQMVRSGSFCDLAYYP